MAVLTASSLFISIATAQEATKKSLEIDKSLLKEQKKEPTKLEDPNKFKPKLAPMSGGVTDPRIDIYLTKMDIEEYWPLWRKQYVMQVADAFLFSPKYRLVVLSPEANANGQLELHVSVNRFGRGWNIKTSVIKGEEELDSATRFSKSTRRDKVLKLFRETLYELVIGKKRTEEKRVHLVKMEKKALRKALRIPARPRPLTEEEKQKLLAQAEEAKRKEEVIEDSGTGKPTETIPQQNPKATKDLIAQQKDSEESKVDDGPSIFSYFPRVFVKASMVIGDPITGVMPSKQGTRTTELGFGLNKTNWGTSLSYGTRSYIVQTIATVEASQKISEFRINQEIFGFNLFTSPKDRLHSKEDEKDSWYLGVSAGRGTMSFSGDIFTIEIPEYSFITYGVYLNILGVVNLEFNYLTFQEEPMAALRMADQYPAMGIRFSVGYPL